MNRSCGNDAPSPTGRGFYFSSSLVAVSTRLPPSVPPVRPPRPSASHARQAISASLADFHGSNGGGLYGSDTRDFGGSSTFGRGSTDSYLSATGKSDPSFAFPRRGGRGSNSALSAGRLSGRGAASRASSGRGERRGGASSAWAGDGGRSSGIGMGSGRADCGGWDGGGGGGGGGGSGNSPRKRRRPGSPNSPPGKPSVRICMLLGGGFGARLMGARAVMRSCRELEVAPVVCGYTAGWSRCVGRCMSLVECG